MKKFAAEELFLMCLYILNHPRLKSNIGRMTFFERFEYFRAMKCFED